MNFHYAYLPDAVTDNYQINKPVAFDETADGCHAPDRRREAWAFIMAGGAEYSNLDWSFANDDMTGLGRNPAGRRQSGKEVRDQLQILMATMRSFDFIHSKPVDSLVSKGLPEGLHLYGLANDGNDYIFYWLKTHKTEISSWSYSMPAANYRVKFIDPVDGHIIHEENIDHPGGSHEFQLPDFPDDLVLRITKKK